MSEKIIHEVIARTAKSLAEAAYEEMASVNDFYAANPDVNLYVAGNWQHYIPFARQSLVNLLTKDFSFEIACGQYTPESVDLMKSEVCEALVIDGSYKASAAPSSSLLMH